MQETQELTLPISAKKVMICGYVTGLIDQEVRKIEASANKTSYEVDVDTNDIQKADPNQPPENSKVIVNIDAAVQIDADNKLLELMVLAVDGNNGDVMNQLLALPAPDVNFVLEQVKALRAGSKAGEEEKKA